MKLSREQLADFIHNLDGYEGYIQYSHRAIQSDSDIFYDDKKIRIQEGNGFIYEAHFCNGVDSIAIKQVNALWFVTKTDITLIEKKDITSYHAKHKNVKMAQVWEIQIDEFCNNMKVQKLKDVVFAGFEGTKINKPIDIKVEMQTTVENLSYKNLSQKDREILLEHFLEIFKAPYINSILKADS